MSSHAHSLSPMLAWPHASALARAALHRATARLLRPLRLLSGRSVTLRAQGLALPIPLPARSGPAHGADIYRGLWRLAGHEISAEGRSVFARHDAPRRWQEELHAFEWIFELLQPHHPLWRMTARQLVLDWAHCLRQRGLPPVALHPAVSARRMINLVTAAPLLLEEAEPGFTPQLMHVFTTQMRLLLRQPLAGLLATDALWVLIAQAVAAYGIAGFERLREPALRRLDEELQRQFLPDGGHVSRAPHVQLAFLSVLLPLRHALEMAGMEPPAGLQAATEKGIPMLRLFQHADGGLALFHGGDALHRARLRALLNMDVVGGAPLNHAPHAGYARLARGGSVALVDVGAPPAPVYHATGALSPLALEFSCESGRIFTSCGAPLNGHPDLMLAARTSAAHCMPTLESTDAGVLLDNALTRTLFGQPLAGGAPVTAELTSAEPGTLLEASHGAYGLQVRRRLFLTADGNDLRGEDAFLPPEGAPAPDAPYAIRFHLHPAVNASLSRDGRSLLLVLPNRTAWSFSAKEGAITLEESLLMAGESGPRPTRQIVLRGDIPQEGCAVHWKLARVEPSANTTRRRKSTAKAPSLPLE